MTTITTDDLRREIKELYSYNAAKQSINVLPYVPEHDPLLQQDKRLHREEILKYQNRDVHSILTCTNNKFWSLVFHDSSIEIFLDTFLKNASRPFDMNFVMRDGDEDDSDANAEDGASSVDDLSIIDKLESLLYRRVFMIHWRMVNDIIDKEQIVHNRSKSDHGRILRECSLLTIPKLLDLSVLYGYSNTNMMRRLLGRLFVICPSYFEDFKSCMQLMQKPMEDLIQNSITSDPASSSSSLNNKNQKKKKSVAATFRELSDVVNYLYDISFTLRSFLDMLPFISYAYIQLQNQEGDVLKLLTVIYERVLPSIKSLLDATVSDLSKQTTKEEVELVDTQSEIIYFQLDQIKLNILSVFNTVITECFLDPILDISEVEDEVSLFHQKYLKNLSITNSEDNMEQIKSLFEMSKNKVSSQQQQQPIFNKLIEWISSLIVDVSSSPAPLIIDFDKLYKLQQSIKDIADQDDNQEVKNTCASLNNKLSDLKKRLGIQDNQQIDGDQEKLDEDEAESLSTLKEIFPDYGEGFLLTCLDHYKGNCDKATDAILNDKLPKYLQRLDKKMKKRKQRSRINVTSLVKEEPMHGDHAGMTPTDMVSPVVWENTDMFGHSGNVQVYIGKKKRSESIDTIDEGLRQRIIENYMYDDEYDDSYDDVLQLGDDEVASDSTLLNTISSEKESDSSKTQKKSHDHAKQHAQAGRSADGGHKKEAKPAKETKLKTNSPPFKPEKSSSNNTNTNNKANSVQPSVGRGRGYFKPKTTPEASKPGTANNQAAPVSSTKSNPSPVTNEAPKKETTSAAKTTSASTASSTTPTVNPLATHKQSNERKQHEKQKRKQQANKKRMLPTQ